MSFIFRYQKILDFRIEQEEQAEMKLAEWVLKYNKYQKELESAREEKKNIQNSLLNSKDSSQNISAQLLMLSQAQNALMVSLQELSSPLEESRKNYLEAKKNREIFELLKKKDYDAYMYAEKKKNQKKLENYSISSYIQKNQK